jgi:iron complex outermembrane receptor protein
MPSQVITIVTFLLFAVVSSHAADKPVSTLTGRITDPQSAAVIGAEVNLYTRDSMTHFHTTTNGNGEYRFERLLPGEYLLEVEAVDFGRSIRQQITLQEGSLSTHDVALTLAGHQDEIVVTASGTPQSVDEVSKAITTIDSQEIDDRDEFAVSEALRNVPGLRVQQQGGPGAFTNIKVRGLRNEDTAVLIDGLRFRDAAAPQGDASGLLEDLVSTNLDRLEVLRGSGSSLYGTNAIGGVINMVTAEKGGRTHGSLLAEGGSLGLFRGRAQIGGGLKNDRITYGLGITHLNVWNGVDGDDAARNTGGQGKVSIHFSPTTTLWARVYAADTFLQVNTSPEAVGLLPPSGIINAVPLALDQLRRYEQGTPISELNLGSATYIPSANDPDSSRAANFVSGAVSFSQQATSALGYTITYQGLKSHRGFFDGPGGVSFQPFGNTRADYDGQIHTLNARSSVKLGNYNFLDTGYEFENEHYLNRNFPESASDNSVVDVTQRSHTFFAQDQVRLLRGRLQFSAAFRAQFFNLRDPQFTPAENAPYAGLTFRSPPTAYTGDGSVAYFFQKTGTKIRAHVGNGYRVPSLYERFGTYYSSFGYSTYGDPRLRPDRSVAVDSGVDQSLWKDRLRLSATYFYTRLQQVIIFDFSGAIDAGTDPFGRFGGYRNTNGGLARGLEVSATAAATSSLDLRLAYTYTNADERQPIVENIIRSFIIPNHQFSALVTQRVGRRFFINFDLTTSSDYLAPIFNPVDFSSRAYRFHGLVKADLGGSYRWALSDLRAVRFYGKVDNILNRQDYESGFRTPGAVGIGGVQFEF